MMRKCSLIWMVTLMVVVCCMASADASTSPPTNSEIIAYAKEALKEDYGTADEVLDAYDIDVHNFAPKKAGFIGKTVWFTAHLHEYIDEGWYEVDVLIRDSEIVGATTHPWHAPSFFDGIAQRQIERGKLQPIEDAHYTDIFLALPPSEQAYYTDILLKSTTHEPRAVAYTGPRLTEEQLATYATDAKKDESIAFAKAFLTDTLGFPQEAFSLYDISSTLLYAPIRAGHIWSVEFTPVLYTDALASHVVEVSVANGTLTAYWATEGWRAHELDTLLSIREKTIALREENGVHFIWTDEGQAAYYALWADAGFGKGRFSIPTHAISTQQNTPVSAPEALLIAQTAIRQEKGVVGDDPFYLDTYALRMYADDPAYPVWYVHICVRFIDVYGIFDCYDAIMCPETGSLLEFKTVFYDD